MHKLFQHIIMMKYRDIYHHQDFILTSIGDKQPGYPCYIKKVENCIKRLLKSAELYSELTPHSLRHTHSSLLAEAGISLQQIMEQLGHKDEDTTKNVYLHVTNE